MKWTGLFSLVGAVALTVACGDASNNDIAGDRVDDPAAVGTTGDAPDGAGDIRGANDVQEFVNEAAMHGHAEVQLGQLASERGVSSEVKQFAQMMVKEHTKANDELEQTAQAHNMQVPMTIDDKHQELMQKLRGTSGAEFDREYMSAMVEGHEEAKDLLEGRARRADNRAANGTAATGASPDANQQAEVAINQWAAKTLPSVEQHLERAKAINDRLDDAGRTRTN